MINPDMGSWYYWGDNNGNMIEQEDSKGNVIQFQYDSHNWLILKQYFSTNDPDVRFVYDNPHINNRKGKIYLAENYKTSGEDTVSFVKNVYENYDDMGQVTDVEKSILSDADVNTSETLTTSYDYSPAGNLQSVVYPDQAGSMVSYEYYPHTGLLKRVFDPGPDFPRDGSYPTEAYNRAIIYNGDNGNRLFV